MTPLQDDADHIEISQPSLEDGARIEEVARACRPMDGNSVYAYLLLCSHFSKTCVVAKRSGNLLGFISAYLKPAANDTLFIWQIAVLPSARQQGVAVAMLRHLLRRTNLRHIRHIEATASPSNKALRKLFTGLSQELDTSCEMKMEFSRNLFQDNEHEDEYLYRIGPINLKELINEFGNFQSFRIKGALLHTFIPNRIYPG
jgi:L-2,4-diaminobutyric acid acetyltransferase